MQRVWYLCEEVPHGEAPGERVSDEARGDEAPAEGNVKCGNYGGTKGSSILCEKWKSGCE